MGDDNSHFFRRLYWNWAGLFLSGFFIGCEDDIIHKISPQIAVDACQDEPVSMNGVILGGTGNCNVALGRIDLADEAIKEIAIYNPSAAPLTINGLTLHKEAQSPFMLDAGPQEIQAGQKLVIKLRFRPSDEQEVFDKVIIDSNASNTPGGKPIEVHVNASAVNNGLPDIEVNSLQCNFGRVGIEQTARCELSIKNVGVRPLVLYKTQFVEGSLVAPTESVKKPFGFFGRPPQMNEKVEAGSSFTFMFSFTPDVVGEFKQNLLINSNDPDERNQVIEILGQGALAPIAQCGIKTVNNVAYVSGQGIEPLDDVIITAEGSSARAQGATVANFHWELVKQPQGSTAWLTNVDAKESGFAFADDVHGVDLAGGYEVRLVVTDSFGLKSSNECRIKFDAIPTDSIHVQLVWDTNFGDMDLHLGKRDERNRFCVSSLNNEGRPGPLGEKCEDADFVECNYASCRNHHNDQRPTWDNDDARGTSGDPSLDIDDLSGYGPENINIDMAQQGLYLVSAHNFGGGRAAGNTLRIYLYGQLAGEFYRVLQPNEWWEVAIIQWPDNMSAYPCIEDLSTLRVECPVPIP